MQNEKLKKFTDFFVKYRRYFCAAVLFVILVVILVKCTGPQKDQKETQNGTQGVTRLQNLRKSVSYKKMQMRNL